MIEMIILFIGIPIALWVLYKIFFKDEDRLSYPGMKQVKCLTCGFEGISSMDRCGICGDIYEVIASEIQNNEQK